MNNETKYTITENLEDHVGYEGQPVTKIMSWGNDLYDVQDENGNEWTCGEEELTEIKEGNKTKPPFSKRSHADILNEYYAEWNDIALMADNYNKAPEEMKAILFPAKQPLYLGSVTVKPDTKWIYAGHTLKILKIKPADKFGMEFGRQFKLCLIGTEFESKYPTSPYTFMSECDLIINEIKQPDTPLYKVLNEQRTHGEWRILEQDGLFPAVVMSGTDKAFIESYGRTGFTMNVGGTDERINANAQYTALAVNNLHHFGEFAEWVIKEIQTTPDELSDALLGVIILKAKEALSKIS